MYNSVDDSTRGAKASNERKEYATRTTATQPHENFKEYATTTTVANQLHETLVGNKNPSGKYFSIDWEKLEDIWNAEMLTAKNRSMMRRREEPTEIKTTKKENFNGPEKMETVKETRPLFSLSPKLSFSWGNFFSKPHQSSDETKKSIEDSNDFNANWKEVPKVQNNLKQDAAKHKTDDNSPVNYKEQKTHKANQIKIATDKTHFDHFPKGTKENRLATDQNRKHKFKDNERMKEFSEIWQKLKNTFEELPKSDSPRKRKTHQRPHTRPHSRRQ